VKASTWVFIDEAPVAAPAGLTTKLTGRAGDTVVPEETIFGIVSRHHVLTGHPTSGDTLIALLNRRTVSLGTAFPSGLHRIFAQLLLPVSSIEELIESHTILPCFRPFMNTDHYNRLADAMAKGAACNTKIALGLLASRVGAEDVLRYCPTCAQVDIETIGVATWYRAHQFPGVLVCPYHGVPLIAIRCLAQRCKRHQLFLPATAAKWEGQQTAAQFSEQARGQLLRVARLCTQLFALHHLRNDPLDWRRHYLAQLADRGLATARLRVRQQALRHELLDFWSAIQSIPPFTGVLARCEGDDSWLTSLYRRPRATHHPLLHVLLIGFLAESIESFLWTGVQSPSITATVSGRSLSDTECRITALAAQDRTMRQIGKELGLSVNAVLIKAEKLGIGFTRRTKKVDAAARCRVRHALAAGDAILHIVKTTGLSASTVNRILGADAGLQKQRAASVKKQRQRQARDNLRTAAAAMPSAGFKALQAALGADFTWLYRHDLAWLREHLPVVCRPAVASSPVDWGARDRAMVKRLEQAVAEILNPSTRPVRVTINEIGRRTGNASWLDKHISKMPMTRVLLSQAIEATSAFQARRHTWWEDYNNPTALIANTRYHT